MENEPQTAISNTYDWVFAPKKGAKANGLALGNMVFAQNDQQLK